MLKFQNILIFVLFILSILYSIYKILAEFDLVKAIYSYTGFFALIFLTACLFFSLFKFKFSKDYPKYLGYFSFIWAFGHFLSYFAFSKNFNLFLLIKDSLTKYLELSGLFTFLLLFVFFISSFKIFNFLSKSRKLAYLCLFTACVHYFLSIKIAQFSHYAFLITSVVFILIKLIQSKNILNTKTPI